MRVSGGCTTRGGIARTRRFQTMTGFSLRGRLTMSALLLLLGTGALAETAYISARVEVGLHEERSAHSAIIGLLPEGTELEVIERDGDAVMVRIEDGREGWIPSEYISSEASAPAELADLRQRLPELMAALEREQSARTRAEERISALERELSELGERLAAPAANAEDAQGEENSRILQDFELLAEENRELKRQIAALEEMQAEARQSGSDLASGAIEGRYANRSHPPGVFERPFWHWLLLCFVVLFAFGLGAFAVDWLTRRRHGGYRI